MSINLYPYTLDFYEEEKKGDPKMNKEPPGYKY